MKENNILDEILDNISIETEIEVLNEFAFINLIHDLGYREEKMWNRSDDHILNKLMLSASKHTEEILTYESAFIDNFCLYLKDKGIELKDSLVDDYFKLKTDKDGN